MVSHDVLIKKYATVLSKIPDDDVLAAKLNPTPRIALFLRPSVRHISPHLTHMHISHPSECRMHKKGSQEARRASN